MREMRKNTIKERKQKIIKEAENNDLTGGAIEPTVSIELDLNVLKLIDKWIISS